MNASVFKIVASDPPYIEVSNGSETYKLPGGVDISSWQPLSETFSKDKDAIYRFEGVEFQQYRHLIDVQTFEVILEDDVTHCYFKDAHHVYIQSYRCPFTILEGADPNSFEVMDVSKGFSCDKDHLYYFDSLLPYRMENLKLLNEHYALADGCLYAGYTQLIEGADVDSFVIPEPNLVSNVAKDKNHVYFRNRVVEGADPESFYFLSQCVEVSRPYYYNCDIDFYAKDNASAYFVKTISKAFKHIRPKNIADFRFEVIDEQGYGYDGKDYYYQGKKVKK